MRRPAAVKAKALNRNFSQNSPFFGLGLIGGVETNDPTLDALGG
jgi:hypothetical protein